MRWWSRRVARAVALGALCGLVSPVGAQGPPPQMPVRQLEQQPPLPPLPSTQLDDRLRARLDGPAKLTMDFPRATPVLEVLQLLAAGTPFSVVAEPNVTATFSGTLKDVTMRQALESVLQPLDLDYVVQGSVIRVFVRRPATRLFDVNGDGLLDIATPWEQGGEIRLYLHPGMDLVREYVGSKAREILVPTAAGSEGDAACRSRRPW